MPTTNNASRPFSERLFGALLHLLPEEFRDRFSGEMQSLFRDQRHDACEAAVRPERASGGTPPAA